MDFCNENTDLWELQQNYEMIPSIKEINKMSKKQIFKMLQEKNIFSTNSKLEDVDTFLYQMNKDSKFYNKKND